jgi:hypothetical protein
MKGLITTLCMDEKRASQFSRGMDGLLSAGLMEPFSSFSGLFLGIKCKK